MKNKWDNRIISTREVTGEVLNNLNAKIFKKLGKTITII